MERLFISGTLGSGGYNEHVMKHNWWGVESGKQSGEQKWGSQALFWMNKETISRDIFLSLRTLLITGKTWMTSKEKSTSAH